MKRQRTGGKMKAFNGGKIFQGNEFREGLCVVFDSKIVRIAEEKDIDRDEISVVYNLDGKYLVPGFVDVHVHGFHGADVMDEDFGAIEKISLSLAKRGVTSFLPTTMTMPMRRIHRALENIRSFKMQQRRKNGGSKVIGAHLEGPFLDQKYCGAQSPGDMKTPETSILEEFGDIIKVITIAPEIEGGLEFIEKYGKDFLFSLGHSDSDYDTAMRAFKLGAKSTTHLFNAMTPLHHRRPGLTGAALTCDEAFTELICDNIHIHSALYKLILRCKGAERIMLITDCMRAGGMCAGRYELGGQPVIVQDGKCTLENGTIAGSILTMEQALKNMVLYGGISLEKAIPMTSCNQARYLGMDKEIGNISVGMAADFVVLDDALDVKNTFINGQSVSTD